VPVTTYLDHGATTPLRDEVAQAMEEARSEPLGNPTGSHRPAQRARRLLEEARDEVAAQLGRSPGEIVFTSGGTESANLAVFGTVLAALECRGSASLLCSAIEHPAVWESSHAVARREAVSLRLLPVDHHGVVDLNALGDALDPGVTLVSVMMANNETGVVQPLAEVVEMVREQNPACVIFTDAVQAAPFMNLAQCTSGADLVAVSAHKVGGPVGIGVLAIRAGVELAAQQLGGGQERERRSGTQNVLGAVGLATALRVAAAERVAVAARAAGLREVLADGLMGAVVDAYRTVPPDVATLPGHLHLCFPGIEREELLVALGERGICASGGSSCASGALEPSRVLIAMEVSAGLARGAIRFTLGRQTTTDEIAYVVGVVPEVVGALRHGG